MKAVTAGEMIAILQKLEPDTPLVILYDGTGEYFPVRKKEQKLVEKGLYFGGDKPTNIKFDEDGNLESDVFKIAEAYQ